MKRCSAANCVRPLHGLRNCLPLLVEQYAKTSKYQPVIIYINLSLKFDKFFVFE